VVGAATALNVAVGLSAALRALHAAAHSLRQPSGGAEEYSGLSGVVPFSALKIAAWRAIETELGSVALFNDPLAASLAGTTAVAAAKSRLTDNTPMPSRLAIRTRYFDDKLTQALEGPSKSVIEYLLGTDLFGTSAGRKPISQVVLLGAGMDTRVFRLRTKSGTVADVAFEVDMPEVLNAKQAVLEKCDESLTQLTLVKRRVSVGVDLNHPKWSETLLAAGFDPTAPTVWLAEGLTMYLEPHAMAALTATLHELSAPHSVLLVSMVNATAVAKAQASTKSELMKTWQWGDNDPEGFFAGHGWDHVAVEQVGGPTANYGRWNDPVPPRVPAGEPDVGRTLYVTARKSKPAP